MDKTGTLTQGVFEVTAVHHNSMNEDKLIELTALAESASSHPISKSLQKAHGKNDAAPPIDFRGLNADLLDKVHRQERNQHGVACRHENRAARQDG